MNQNLEKRRTIRVTFRNSVQFQTKPEHILHGSLAGDLGTGGIKLTLNKFLPLHTPVILQFACGEQRKMLSINGRVVWVSEIPYSERFQAGIKFDSQDILSQNEINQYLQRLTSPNQPVTFVN